MRTGLTVVAVCLMISAGLGWSMRGKFKTGLTPTQDLVVGLMYFMEDHAGRFPASEDEFLAQPFVEHLPDGTFKIVPKATTAYTHVTHEYPIRNLSRYRILWGADLESLTVDDRSVVRNAAGERVELIRWPDSPKSGNAYTLMLLAEAEKIRAHSAASQPVGETP